jgi:lysine 6-dehydrogenase
MVGGVAQDREAPYGYVITWSPEDLLEEYTRPARIVRDGAPVNVPVFSDLEHVEVEGVGEMEAFYSDGLRSLLTTLPGVRQMGEKTLRWPGHAEAVQPLVAEGRLVEELRARCTQDPPRDLVVMLVRMSWARGDAAFQLVDRYDPGTNRSAMSRTTALTTSVVAQLGAAGGLDRPGVSPLELVAREPKAYAFVVEAMAERGVRIERTDARS